MISAASNAFIFFVKGLSPEAMHPIILNFLGLFLPKPLVSFDRIANPSKAALLAEGYWAGETM